MSYLNRVQSSRQFERERGLNVELIWLTARLIPGHKTLADSPRGWRRRRGRLRPAYRTRLELSFMGSCIFHVIETWF